ncbi:ribosomal-protein-alanine acetyltransferase [Tsuneonella deserti]|uniref:Ribosomal-protein-alanine acetyltransferase n=1 Tax=Tsuneonella deserti TaxID=2035528 RepID=A0ABQ1S838_9SPHN|nr:GNAT family N-acetyltransferase [Tsuneonella deserti]GGD95199.1 ribosomal-protein-alanine acetyltransferase [Tsuneonella deserti]
MTDDLDRLMEVMEAAFEPQWGEAWTRRQVSESLVFPHTHSRLFGEDGQVALPEQPAAGFTLVRAAPGEEELLLIAVHPSHRGRGLGRRLLDQVIADARQRGAERVFLEMRSNNPAERLYRAAGFEPIGRRKDYYRLPSGKRLDAITFVCLIKGSST